MQNQKSDIRQWFKEILNEAALAMVDHIVDNPDHSRHITEKEMELIKKGMELGIIEVKENLFTVMADATRKYDAFTLNREYFTQFATLISLVDEYRYPVADCKFEYHYMDVCVFKDQKPYIYVEAKVSDSASEKLLKEIEEKYSKDIDSIKDIPDRGNDALRKAKYIFNDKPRYLLLVTPKQKRVFSVDYQKNGFVLNRISDIPFFDNKGAK